MTGYEILTLFIIPVLSGFLGAFILWLIQQTYLNRRERLKEKNQKFIKAPNSEKIITDDVFQNFDLGTSIEHMKAMFGPPNKFRRVDYSVFPDEKEVNTNSYLYIFSNAYLKVTSKDNEAIDTLTIFSYDGSLSFEGFCLPCEFESYRLGEATVPLGLVEDAPGDFRIEINSNHTYIRNRFDSSFALEFYTGAPFYRHYTFFGFGGKRSSKYFETKDPKLFIGEVIDGICISSSVEEVYFIYENEIR